MRQRQFLLRDVELSLSVTEMPVDLLMAAPAQTLEAALVTRPAFGERDDVVHFLDRDEPSAL